MGQNVNVRSGYVMTLLPSSTTGDVTGAWRFKDAPKSAIQATVVGSGAIGCTVTIQASNDAIYAVATPVGTITLSGTTSDSDGFTTDAPWKYLRAVVSSSSGSITSIEVTMSV